MTQAQKINQDGGPNDLTQPRRRGRPKGTGIDDSAVLNRIARAMEADQDLKPTTAIKRAGITDPSIVRRLRDKLRDDPNPPSLPTASAASTPIVNPTAFDAPPSAIQTTRAAETKTQIPAEDPAEQEKKQREAATLAAYLQAMLRSSTGSAVSAPEPIGSAAAVATPESQQPQAPPASNAAPRPNPQPTSIEPPKAPATHPTNTFADMFQKQMASMMSMGATPTTGLGSSSMMPPFGMPNMFPGMPGIFGAPTPPQPTVTNPMQGMGFPFMPPFLQPFQPRPDPKAPPQTPSMVQQVEGLKLAVEAMVAISRLQLHYAQNVAAYSPMALMLQGQTFMGQMLLASLTGQHAAMKPKTST